MSSQKADSGPFIDFMLEEIMQTLKAHQGPELSRVGINVGIKEQAILSMIDENAHVTIEEMAQKIGVSHRQCERIIAQMRTDGLIKRVGSNKTGFWQLAISNW